MVASTCSRNYFIPEKYKTTQLFNLNFLQNSRLVQLYVSASEFRGVGNIPGSLLWKPLQLFRCIRNDVTSITKDRSLQCWFQSREQKRNQLEPSQEITRDDPVLSHCSLLRNPLPKLTGTLDGRLVDWRRGPGTTSPMHLGLKLRPSVHRL
jgi:hypothetical protein